jgi:UDP-N-acetylmuramoylalanine--D-glutamate ligase
LVVLAGGQSKQGDAAAWLEQLQKRAAAVVLYGAAREEFTGLLHSSGFGGVVRQVEDLEAAVALAITLNFYNNHSTVDIDRADDLKG